MEGARIGDLRQRLPHQPAGADGGQHGVARIVDGACLIEMAAGEVEGGMAEDRLVQPGLPAELGAEDRNGLQMRAAVQPLLQLAQEGRHVVDEMREAVRVVAGLRGMHLVPQVPGEDDAAAAPALRGKGQPRLHRGARRRAHQQLAADAQGPPLARL